MPNVSVAGGTLETVPEQVMILTPVALLLAGSVCFAWSSTSTGRSRRRRLLATETLWIIAGLLSLGTVAITIVQTITQPMIGTTIGARIATLFIGSVVTLAAVALLGLSGFWTRLHGRRKHSASPHTQAPSAVPGHDT